MVHGKSRISYWIDRRLTGLAGPDYDATISFRLPFELGDCQYGKSCLKTPNMGTTGSKMNTGATVISFCFSQTCINPEANND